MRHLLTGAGVTISLAIACTSNSFAQSSDNEFDAADRFTSRDLLEKSERDQRLWLSGVLVGAAHGVGLHDPDASSCLINWYFEDEAQTLVNIRANMERFPDHTPAIVLLAMARRECPGLVSSN